jgi:hypothetical protein
VIRRQPQGPAQGIVGARSVLCAWRKEWSEAEPRKARFFLQEIAPQSPAKKMRPNSSSEKFLIPHCFFPSSLFLPAYIE